MQNMSKNKLTLLLFNNRIQKMYSSMSIQVIKSNTCKITRVLVEKIYENMVKIRLSLRFSSPEPCKSLSKLFKSPVVRLPSVRLSVNLFGNFTLLSFSKLIDQIKSNFVKSILMERKFFMVETLYKRQINKKQRK